MYSRNEIFQHYSGDSNNGEIKKGPLGISTAGADDSGGGSATDDSNQQF